MARGCESDELAPQTRDFLSICTRGFRLREPSSLQSSGLTLRPLEPRSTTPGGRAASESERANRTSLRALLPTKSHASTSEHTSVRREHAQCSLHGPRQSASAKLYGALRRCLGVAPEGGSEQKRATWYKGEAYWYERGHRGRHEHARQARRRAGDPLATEPACTALGPLLIGTLFRRPKRGRGDRGCATSHREGGQGAG